MESVTLPKREITIDSDWITTILTALLFAFIAFLLGWSIRDLWFDKFDQRLQPVRNEWFDTLTCVLGSVYSFLFAYSFPKRHLKIAFVLLGTKYLFVLAAFHSRAGAGMRHFAAIAGAIAGQIAYAIILFAIARWFRTVVRQVHPGDHGVSDS